MERRRPNQRCRTAGRVAGITLSVGRGRLGANVIVLGLERELRTEDVLALREQLLARLAVA